MASSRSTASFSGAAASWLPDMSPALLSFRLAPQAGETLVPESAEELTQLREPLRPRAVDASRPLAPLAHQTGLLQHRQVLGDGGTAHVEMRGDVACRQLAVADEGEDVP